MVFRAVPSSPTAIPELPDSMHTALQAFVRMHRANELAEALLAQRHACSMSDMRALVLIAGGGDTTPSSIARTLGLTTGAITSLVDRLDAAGWAHRVPNPHDRRSSYLELLPSGREVLNDITTLYVEAFRDATAGPVSAESVIAAFTSIEEGLLNAVTRQTATASTAA